MARAWYQIVTGTERARTGTDFACCRHLTCGLGLVPNEDGHGTGTAFMKNVYFQELRFGRPSITATTVLGTWYLVPGTRYQVPGTK